MIKCVVVEIYSTVPIEKKQRMGGLNLTIGP